MIQAGQLTRRSLLAALLGASALVGLGRPVRAAEAPRAAIGDFGLDLAGMNRDVVPGDDFYMYANGAWQRDTKIPPDKADLGGFDALNDANVERVRAILEEAAASPDPEVRKLNTYYANYMDTETIEGLGVKPIAADLARIEAIANPADVARALARLLMDTRAGPFVVGIGETNRRPDRYIIALSQGPLQLQTKDAYTNPASSQAALRAGLRAHMGRLMALAGLSDAEARAEQAWQIELKLAEMQWPADKRAGGGEWKPSAFNGRAKGFEWAAFFGEAGLTSDQAVYVSQPSVVSDFGKLAAETSVETWRDYLRWRTVQNFAPIGPVRFSDESFAMSSLVNGAEAPRERWKRAIDRANGVLGDAIGKLFVEKHFPPEAEAKARAMIDEIRSEFRRRIAGLPWLEPKTIRRAQMKLDALKIEVGRPDVWRDYSGLKMVAGDAYGDRLRANAFEHRRQISQLGRPVDRREWPITLAPQTVNAMSSPVLVKLMIPAGILQPPFFDAGADAAVNYGAIGHVIGHEISHHLDNRGAMLDENGKAALWWSLGDLFQFGMAIARLERQYNGYEALPGMRVNGRLTQGENISDLGGVNVAYDAYRASLKGKEAPVLAGLTGDQRFFLGFAQVYRRKTREQAERGRLAADPHSPSRFRVWTVRNIDAWYRAFEVKPGQAMFLPPDQRVRIW
ncbi:M13 family metallopeptidase [soil metagenome]